ncbi:MAG: hypothetical protein ACI8RZ_005883, partial [Myxococcota bacterium]
MKMLLFLLLCSCDESPPAPELLMPLNLDRDGLWNYILTGEAAPESAPGTGILPEKPFYTDWSVMPIPDIAGIQPFENKRLDLPTHGRFVTTLVNETAHEYLKGYLDQIERGSGEVPLANLPAGSVILKLNYPGVVKNGRLVQAPEPAVLTVAYKPSDDYCESQTDRHRYNGTDCLGGDWMWAFYGLEGTSPEGSPLHRANLDTPVTQNTESFCINCHDPGARTDYLRGLQEVARIAADLNASEAGSAPSVITDLDPFCADLPIGSDMPLDVSKDPNSILTTEERQKMFDCFSWRSFIALNWEADAERGKPNTGVPFATVTANTDRVWETYKATWEVFQPENETWEGSDAGPWSAGRPVPTACDAVVKDKELSETPPVLSMLSKSSTRRDVANETGQAFAGSFGTLFDRNNRLVRYQVLFNETEFNSLVPTAATRDLFPAGPDKGAAVTLPDNSVEVKASWRELCLEKDCEYQDTEGEYYTRDVLVYTAKPNSKDGANADTCELVTYGLVGLHVAQKTFWAPQWIWATFEHVKNAPYIDTKKKDESGVEETDLTGFSLFDPECTPPTDWGFTSCAEQPFLAPAKDSVANPCCENHELNRFPGMGFPPWMGKDDPAVDGVPNRLTRLVPVGPETLNADYQSKLAGTVWANYMLVNTQWPMNGRVQDATTGQSTINKGL